MQSAADFADGFILGTEARGLLAERNGNRQKSSDCVSVARQTCVKGINFPVRVLEKRDARAEAKRPFSTETSHDARPIEIWTERVAVDGIGKGA